MNPHAPYSTSPKALLCSLWQHHHLIKRMAYREIIGRYKGSIFGIAWSFITPLIMLTIYTFVFSVIFKARWGIEIHERKINFALILFIGLIIHSLLAEVLNSAPNLISNNTNYVKKIIFPIETLMVINICSALFHMIINVFVLISVFIFLNGIPSLTILYTPLTLIPILPIALGIGWLVASIGVYFRDLAQIIGIFTAMLLFLSPVFYPIEALPKTYQPILYCNPLTFPIEQTRKVIIYSTSPNWLGLSIYTTISMLVCWLGFWGFQKTRKGFADVI